MKRKVFIIILFYCCLTVSSFAQKTGTEVTYIGNAGFLIDSGNKKILIDAIFKGFKGNYELPQEVQNKLKNAEAPFDDVDLILVTHAHGDHVSPDMVRQHMQNNPNAVFASTQQLVDHMKDSTGRSVGFNPTKEKSDKKEIHGITIESFLLPHGANAQIINIGFLISVNGITIFQTGDADFDQFTFEEFRSLRLPEKNIDLSLIQHYYLRGDSLSTKFVREAIGGSYIFPIHYHFTTPTFDTTLVRQHYPDAIIFKKELQSWQMPDKKNDFPTLTGAYLGQTPPGLIPEVFAPGIVSDTSWAEHSQIAISPNGDEIFWSAWTSKYRTEDGKYNTEQLFYSKLQNGIWTEPKIAEFTLKNPHGLNGGPVYSPDGKRIYFYEVKSPWRSSVKRTLFVEKKDGKWSDPKDAGDEYNSDTNNYSPSFTKNGTAYKYSGKILKYKFNDDKFTFIDTVKINKEYRVGWNVYVSPKEEFMIFAAFHKKNYGDLDLHISYNDNGIWGNPINLGDKVNSDKRERFPIVSPDGKYLFFMRHTETQDFFWVSTAIFDEFKKEVVKRN